jgi:hypothetical protein
MNYTNIQNGLLINGTGAITGITTSSLSNNSYTFPTESVVYSYGTNFLSANTSTYTQTQANANFVSANTSSFYTQTQANTNFLSANTSYYTQAQANTNFVSANTIAYGSLNQTSGTISVPVSTSTLPVYSSSLVAGSLSNVTTSHSGLTVSIAGSYLVTFQVSGTLPGANIAGISLYKNTSSGTLLVYTVNGAGNSNDCNFAGSCIIKLAATDRLWLYISGGWSGAGTFSMYGYNLCATKISS